MNILIVEDEERIRRLYEVYLGEEYNLMFCNDGAEGLDRAMDDALEEDKQIDLIITDLRMPQKDGLSFIHMFRAFENYESIPYVPILIVSGFIDDEIKSKVENSRKVKTLDKPFKREELTQAITEMIEIEYRERKRA